MSSFVEGLARVPFFSAFVSHTGEGGTFAPTDPNPGGRGTSTLGTKARDVSAALANIPLVKTATEIRFAFLNANIDATCTVSLIGPGRRRTDAKSGTWLMRVNNTVLLAVLAKGNGRYLVDIERRFVGKDEANRSHKLADFFEIVRHGPVVFPIANDPTDHTLQLVLSTTLSDNAQLDAGSFSDGKVRSPFSPMSSNTPCPPFEWTIKTFDSLA